MDILVLAAGKGTRLRPKTEKTPKPLVNVDNRPILDYTIESIKNSTYTECINIVTGHKSGKFESYVNNHVLGDKIKTTYNEKYNVYGPMLSIYKGLNTLESNEVVILNGDTIYQKEVFESIKSLSDGMYLIVSETDEFRKDDMKVKLIGDYVNSIGKSGIKNPDIKSAGAVYIKGKKQVELFYQILQNEIDKNGGGDQHWHNILEKLANLGHNIAPIVINSGKWVEIDTISDIKRAKDSKLI